MEDEGHKQTEGQEAPPPPPPQAPAPQPVRPGTSGLAIASLVLAFLCAPVGLVLGIIALVQIGRSRGALRGIGLAIAGIVIGGIGALIAPILAAILFPVFARAREAAKQATCLNNLRQVSAAMMMYTSDYDGYYPPADRWNDALQPYHRNPSLLVCPKVGGRAPTYAMNAKLSGQSEGAVSEPADVVSLFESVPGRNQSGGPELPGPVPPPPWSQTVPGRNQSGGPELFPSPPRHMGNHVVGFADGHVKWVSGSESGALVWDLAAGSPSPDWQY